LWGKIKVKNMKLLEAVMCHVYPRTWQLMRDPTLSVRMRLFVTKMK